MNEEEVKARIIFPWLQERGFAPAELSLETSFGVRIGTNIVEVGGPFRPARQRARLDILVRRRGTNLLVIEVKETVSQLSAEDRDQAISYARLLHPVAPFALVTNGTRTGIDRAVYGATAERGYSAEVTPFSYQEFFAAASSFAVFRAARCRYLSKKVDESNDPLHLRARKAGEVVRRYIKKHSERLETCGGSPTIPANGSASCPRPPDS